MRMRNAGTIFEGSVTRLSELGNLQGPVGWGLIGWRPVAPSQTGGSSNDIPILGSELLVQPRPHSAGSPSEETDGQAAPGANLTGALTGIRGSCG
jgi:hypothetical protein